MKQKLEEELSVLSKNITKRNIEISELEQKINELKSENKFDESVKRVRKEQLSKIK